MLNAFAEFKRYLKEEKIASPLTVKSYEIDCLKFHRFLRTQSHSMEIQSIRPEDIRSYLHSLVEAERFSNATVRRALYSLRSFFSWALKWELIKTNPFHKITIPKKTIEGRVRFLSADEREKIIIAAKELSAAATASVANKTSPLNCHGYLIVRLMLSTGVRKSELLSLNWDDVEFAKREITIKRGKGGKLRIIPLEDEELLNILQDRRKKDKAAKKDPVFRTSKGTRLSKTQFHKLIKRICENADLQDVSAHTLRHTFATVLCDRGVNLPTVKTLLGHSDIQSTMIYVHSTQEALREAVKKLKDT